MASNKKQIKKEIEEAEEEVKKESSTVEGSLEKDIHSISEGEEDALLEAQQKKYENKPQLVEDQGAEEAYLAQKEEEAKAQKVQESEIDQVEQQIAAKPPNQVQVDQSQQYQTEQKISPAEMEQQQQPRPKDERVQPGTIEEKNEMFLEQTGQLPSKLLGVESQARKDKKKVLGK